MIYPPARSLLKNFRLDSQEVERVRASCGYRVEILSIPRDKVTHMPPMDVDVCDGAWRKARRSVNNGACVEVASTHATVLVRDSVNPAGLTIKYAAQTWQSFIADTKGGAFDVVR